MNKVLVKLYVPQMEAEYNVWLPVNKKLYKIIKLLVKAIYELSGGFYKPERMPLLYDKLTAKQYDINLNVIENKIENASEIFLI